MPSLLWTIVFVVSIIIEAMTVDLVSIWFSIGAAVALVMEWLHFGFQQQVIAFIIVSILSIIMSRPLAKKYLYCNIKHTNLDRFIGQTCPVIKSITENEKGEIKISGQIWQATSLSHDHILKDDIVEIVGFEGSHVVVKKKE